MIQLYGYKNGVRYELDTYKEEPINLTISAEDITDIPKVESAYSRQFRIPATGNNSIFFNYWYELGVVDFDITQKVKAEIHIDGLIFKSGELRLEGAYVNNETDNVDFEVVFYGETRDFASEVGDIFLNGLNTTELDHILTHEYMHMTQASAYDAAVTYNPGNYVHLNGVVYSCIATTTGNTPPNATYWTVMPDAWNDGLLRYGLAIRGYEYDDDGNIITNGTDTRPVAERTPVNGQITLDNTQQYPFTNINSAIDVRQYTPFIQVKYLIDKIFARTAYTYSADSIFNEDWFANLYTDGIADALGYTPTNQPFCNIAVADGGYPLAGGFEERIEFTNAILNVGNSFNTSTWEYVAGTADTGYSFNVNVQVSDSTYDQGCSFTLTLYKNGVFVADDTASIPANTSATRTLSVTQTLSLNPGDKVWATIDSNGATERPYLLGGAFRQTAGPGSVLGSTLLKNDVKIIDFLKSILNRFRLVMVPSKTEPLEFVIKPWKDYIASGDSFDWSAKLDNSKDIVVKPLFFEQSATVEFKDVEDIDKYNELYIRENNHVYGRYIYDSQNELLKDTREIENIFAPTPVAKVRGADLPDNMILPVLAEESSELDKDGINKFLPMIPKPRLLFWNGQQPTTEGFFDQKISGNEHFVYSCFSSYEFNTPNGGQTWASYPDATTFDLDWGVDKRYFDGLAPVGISTYDRYWSEYIASIYSKDARLITAYFKLDSLDLKDLTFDDVIFINNSYFRVQKVYDAPLNELAVVKVDLVKLLEYTTPYNEGLFNTGDTLTDGGDQQVDLGGGATGDGLTDGGSNPVATTRYFQIAQCGDLETGPYYDVYYDGTYNIRVQDWTVYNGADLSTYEYQVANGDAYDGYGAYLADGSPNFFTTYANGNSVANAMLIVQEYPSQVPTVGFITAGYYDCQDADLRRTSEQLF